MRLILFLSWLPGEASLRQRYEVATKKLCENRRAMSNHFTKKVARKRNERTRKNYVKSHELM